MTRQSAQYANIDYATIQAGVARGRIERSRAIRDAFAALGALVRRAFNARIATSHRSTDAADCAA